MRDIEITPAVTRPGAYRIIVQGRIAESWLEGFGGINMCFDGNNTTLTSTGIDQAALRGLLSWLWDLNLVLLSVTLLGESHNGEGGLAHDPNHSIL